MSKKIAIGAYVTVKYHDDNDPDSFANAYISFGTYEDDAEYDSFGYKDDEIFFYCEDGEAQLKTLMKRDNGEDFWVEDYDVNWIDHD